VVKTGRKWLYKNGSFGGVKNGDFFKKNSKNSVAKSGKNL